MQLYLIRHPQPEVAEGVCYGATDLVLVQPPHAAAQRIRARLPVLLTEDVPLYTSPLQRCRLLAEVLHPSPRSDSRLREIDFGIWEMQPWSSIPSADLDRWAADPLGFRPPSGETVTEFRTRVIDFVRWLHDERTEHAALVAHAGVLKVLTGIVQGLPPKQWMALHFDYECVLSLTA